MRSDWIPAERKLYFCGVELSRLAHGDERIKGVRGSVVQERCHRDSLFFYLHRWLSSQPAQASPGHP